MTVVHYARTVRAAGNPKQHFAAPPQQIFYGDAPLGAERGGPQIPHGSRDGIPQHARRPQGPVRTAQEISRHKDNVRLPGADDGNPLANLAVSD